MGPIFQVFDCAEPDRLAGFWADRVEGLGATRVHEVEERGEFWIVMQDIEGNEFCLQ